MTEIILTLIGAVVTLGGAFFGLVKGGFITIGKKDKEDSGLTERMNALELHFNHENESGFLRIENAIGKLESKLDAIKEDLTVIKTRLNGK